MRKHNSDLSSEECFSFHGILFGDKSNVSLRHKFTKIERRRKPPYFFHVTTHVCFLKPNFSKMETDL